MSGDIKGITIEFRGNATPLNKAIREVNSNIRKTQSELTSINKALKFNPTSVDLWRQKQQLLKQKITETEKDLETLKNAQKQMDADKVDKNSEQYRKLQREIIETDSKLKTFKQQLRSIGSPNLRAIAEGFQQVGSKIEAAGQKMRGISAAAGVATAAIGALTVKSAQAADDINTMSQRFSIGAQDLQMYAAAADLVDTSVEAIAKSHVKLEKSMLSAQDGTGATADAFEKLGVNITNADGSLREGDAVWQDTIAALGKMENETERDALAMQLMGKSANELNPLIEDGGEAYKNLADIMSKYGLDFIDQETLDKANKFNDELDTIKAIGAVAFQTIGSELAAYLAPALEKAVDLVGRFGNWVSQLDARVLAIIAGITGFVAILAPLLIGFGKLFNGISAVLKVVNLLGAGIGALGTGALLPIIAIIGLVAGAFILLWKRSEAFRNAVTTGFEQVKTALASAFQSIMPVVQQFISAISGFVDTIAPILAKLFPYIVSALTHLISILGVCVRIILKIWTVVIQTVGEIITFVANVVTVIKMAVTQVATIFGQLKGIVTSIWEGIKQTVTSVVSAISHGVSSRVQAIKTNVTNVFNALKSIVTTTWTAIKNAMVKPIQTALSLIKTAISKIKNIINNAHLKLPHIKLPHFKVYGGKLPWGIGGKGTPPKISIDWYAQGGIFSKATLAGIGEAGPEAVVPLDKFWDKLDRIAEASTGGGIVVNVYASDGMNEEEIANRVIQKLITETNRRRLAWQ